VVDVAHARSHAARGGALTTWDDQKPRSAP